MREGAGMKGSARLLGTLHLLVDNPNLFKAVFASGLLAAATIMSPAAALVLVELRSHFWGSHMADYAALVNSANGIMAMAFSGSFGRLSDRIDRRLAMVIVGVLGFLPTWALFIVGQNATGLAAYSFCTVFGGIACITVTGCPTCYALVSDVIPPEDREVAFGTCFAGVILIAILGNLGGFMVNLVYSGSHRAILMYCILLDILFFLTVAFVRLPAEERVADRIKAGDNAKEWDCEEQRPPMTLAQGSSETVDATVIGFEILEDSCGLRDEGSRCNSRQDSDEAASISTSAGTRVHSDRERAEEKQVDDAAVSIMAPMQLICDNTPLRYLCIVAGLVSLPEITLTDVSAQYALSQFDLVDSFDGARMKEVTLLFQWPGYGLLLPAFLLVGILAKRFSALLVLQILVPTTGLMLSLPALLRLLPKLWIVPLVGITVPLAMVVFAPLQTLITQVAPEGRVGEAMGAVGASKQVAGLVSNLLVGSLVPVLMSSGLHKPLWVFYPLASCSSLLAFSVASRIRVPFDATAESVKVDACR